jgi:hypothetical protein
MAIVAERAAWEALQGHLPGTPEYDPRSWEAWRRAVRDADAARKRLTEVASRPMRPSERY